jgi:hypothetical protein
VRVPLRRRIVVPNESAILERRARAWQRRGVESSVSDSLTRRLRDGVLTSRLRYGLFLMFANSDGHRNDARELGRERRRRQVLDAVPGPVQSALSTFPGCHAARIVQRPRTALGPRRCVSTGPPIHVCMHRSRILRRSRPKCQHRGRISRRGSYSAGPGRLSGRAYTRGVMRCPQCGHENRAGAAISVSGSR